MATKAQILALLEGVDSGTEVKFKAIGALAAGDVAVIATTAHILEGEIDRSVASGGGDTVSQSPMVIFQQG